MDRDLLVPIRLARGVPNSEATNSLNSPE
jgi:hypothetical protein